jgi:hypothetical protein
MSAICHKRTLLEIRDQAATQFARFKSAMAVTYADMRARRFREGAAQAHVQCGHLRYGGGTRNALSLTS